MNLDAWDIKVDSITIGDMTLYHACAINEEERCVIEGDMEHPDEAYVRQGMQEQLISSLMMEEMLKQQGY